MKCFLFCLLALFGLTKGCHVRHDHSKEMPSARVALDSAQRNDVVVDDRSWEKEDLVVVPEETGSLGTPTDDAQEEVERLMRGERMDEE